MCEARLDTLTKFIKTNGIAEAFQQTTIYTETSGKIEKIKVKNNQLVKKDDILLKLDDEEILLNIETASIQVEKAQKEFDAWKSLGENSNDEQLKLRTGLQEYQVQLKQLELNLEKTNIVAPFDGIITDFDLNTGEKAQAGQTVCNIFDLKKIKIKADILESEISRIDNGNAVVVMFPGIKNNLYHGKVNSIAPYIDQDSRTCEVEVIIENDGNIKSGMYAEIKIAAEKYEDRILVHKDALLVRDGKKLVFAVEDEKAKWQYVDTGEENDKFIEITKGVKANQIIVIDGNFSLSHDANAKIIKEIPYEEVEREF